MDSGWFLPEPPPLCLAIRLKPLTIGHALFLFELDIAYASGREPLLDDLLAGVFVCSQDWRKARRDVGAWWNPLFIKLWMMRSRRLGFASEGQKFQQYFSSAIRYPGAKMRLDAAEAGSPWIFRTIATLMSNLHISYRAAQDMPVIDAHRLILAWGEQVGRAEVKTSADDALWDAAARMDNLHFGKG